MLKEKIEYTDFDGKKQTETVYMHLTRPEVIRFLAGHNINIKSDDISAELKAAINKLIADKDLIAMLRFMDDLLLAAYGEKSEDGKRFVKSQEISERFSETLAYAALYDKLIEDQEFTKRLGTGIVA